MWQRIVFTLFVLVSAGVVAYAIMVPHVVQPAAFNHYKHVHDLNMPCVACHNGALTEVHATLPHTRICMNCHADSTQAIFRPIQTFFKKDGEIPWVRVTHLPDYVYFSHRRHTELGQLSCQQCHGPMEQQTSALTAPLLPISMTRCIACHRKMHAATDCDACHR